MCGLDSGVFGHMIVQRRCALEAKLYHKALYHWGCFLLVDHIYIWAVFLSHQLSGIIAMDRHDNRLNAGRLHGPRVCVVGNGPSALQGKLLGDGIDSFDEVLRFNNFQTKSCDFKRFVDSKCTVHFSDGWLYPTFQCYAAPDATIVLIVCWFKLHRLSREWHCELPCH